MEKNTLKTMPFGKEKIRNLWYYYKWYLLAGLFVLALGTFLVVQCAVKKEAQIRIYWAGPVYFTAQMQQEVTDAFDAVIPDEFGKTVSLVTTVYGGDVRVAATPRENEQSYVDYVGKKEMLTEFKARMRLPDTVICLLSPECFENAAGDGETLRPLSEVLGTLPAGTTENGYGILLSSLPFYKSNTALKQFPEDTVLCLKNLSDFRSAEEYDRQVQAFCAIVAFGENSPEP